MLVDSGLQATVARLLGDILEVVEGHVDARHRKHTESGPMQAWASKTLCILPMYIDVFPGTEKDLGHFTWHDIASQHLLLSLISACRTKNCTTVCSIAEHPGIIASFILWAYQWLNRK